MLNSSGVYLLRIPVCRIEGDDVAFFRAGGMVVSLWDRAKLAEDSKVEDPGGWGGITLAHNTRSPAEVDEVHARVVAAGC